MRSFDNTTKALAVVTFAVLLPASTGCLAQAEDAGPEAVGDALAAWIQEPGFGPGQAPPQQQQAQPPPQQQAPQAPPQQEQPQPPPQQEEPQPPPQQEQPPVGLPDGCAPAVGCAPVVGSAPVCGASGFCGFPGGFNTVVWPITGQFVAFPGLRNGGCL